MLLHPWWWPLQGQPLIPCSNRNSFHGSRICHLRSCRFLVHSRSRPQAQSRPGRCSQGHLVSDSYAGSWSCCIHKPVSLSSRWSIFLRTGKMDVFILVSLSVTWPNFFMVSVHRMKMPYCSWCLAIRQAWCLWQHKHGHRKRGQHTCSPHSSHSYSCHTYRPEEKVYNSLMKDPVEKHATLNWNKLTITHFLRHNDIQSSLNTNDILIRLAQKWLHLKWFCDGKVIKTYCFVSVWAYLRVAWSKHSLWIF